jgi:hypothetical protein
MSSISSSQTTTRDDWRMAPVAQRETLEVTCEEEQEEPDRVEQGPVAYRDRRAVRPPFDLELHPGETQPRLERAGELLALDTDVGNHSLMKIVLDLTDDVERPIPQLALGPWTRRPQGLPAVEGTKLICPNRGDEIDERPRLTGPIAPPRDGLGARHAARTVPVAGEPEAETDAVRDQVLIVRPWQTMRAEPEHAPRPGEGEDLIVADRFVGEPHELADEPELGNDMVTVVR